MSLTVFKAFCELWCHTTNTFCTESGDMSISLWDLRTIGGLLADGAYYKEVILSARKLLSAGRGEMIFQRLAHSSFLYSTDYAKMFMALFNFLLPNGYAYVFEGDRFTHLLPVMTTESELKLQQTHHVHLV